MTDLSPEDREAQEAAIEELDRLAYAKPEPRPGHPGHVPAEPVTPGAVDPMPAPFFGPSPIDALGLGLGSAPAAPDALSVLQTLEDVYASYPQIGSESGYFLRVTRKHPSSFRGHATAGFLADVYEQISLADFKTRFGGGQYEILVMGPGRSKPGEYGQATATRSLRKLTLSIEGPPAGPYGESPDMNRPPYAGSYSQDGRVEIKRMEIDREREREQQRMPSEVLSAAEQWHRRTEEYYQKSLADYREDNSKLELKVDDLQQENGRLRQELERAKFQTETETIRELKARQESDLRDLKTHYESDTRELKARYETEVQRAREEMTRTVEQLRTDHRAALDNEMRRHLEDRAGIESKARDERDRLLDDSRRREESLKRESDMAIGNLRELLKGQIDGLVRDKEAQIAQIERDKREAIESMRERHADAIQMLRETQERELRAIRESERMQGAMTKETSEMRLTMMEQRVHELESALQSAESERDALQREIHKPAAQYLQEARTVAKDLLGMKDASDVPQTGDEDLNWAKVASNAVKGLFEKGPEIARQVLEARGQQAQQRAVVQQQQAYAAQQAAFQEQQARMARAQQPRQLPPVGPPAQPPQAQPRRSPVMAPPPPWAAAGPRPPGAPPPVAYQPAPPPPGPPPPMPRSNAPTAFGGTVRTGPDAAAPSVPVAGSLHHVPQPASPINDPTPPPATAAPPPEQQPFAGPEPPPGQPSEAQINEILMKLGMAIDSSIITPKAFAEAFRAEVGDESLAAILGQLTANDLIKMLEELPQKGPEGSFVHVIISPKGQKYTREMFQEAMGLLTGGPA